LIWLGHIYRKKDKKMYEVRAQVNNKIGQLRWEDHVRQEAEKRIIQWNPRLEKEDTGNAVEETNIRKDNFSEYPKKEYMIGRWNQISIKKCSPSYQFQLIVSI
jgi:hypothetical protein